VILHSFGLLLFILLASIASILFGHDWLSKIRRNAGKSRKKGFPRTMLLVGYLGLAISVTTVFQGLLGLGYVDSAIGSMRTLVAAETRFAKAHPSLGYTCMLSELPPDPLIASPARNGQRNGYLFEITGCRENSGQEPNPGYTLTARPLHKGIPAFCTDQSGILRSDENGSVEKCLKNGPAL
jgi:hypothetical protein